MNPSFPITPKLRRLGTKTPKQLLQMLKPGAEIEAVAGMLSGVDLDIGVPVPLWAKAASKKFCDAVGLTLPPGFDQNEPQALGKVVGLFEVALGNTPSALKAALREFCQNAKEQASNAPAEAAEKFFTARAEGAKITERWSGISQRTKIYLLIAASWRVLETFKSTAELHGFLLSLKRNNGQPIVVPSTDSREIRKICESIGLEFKNQWRKPKLEIPATDQTPKAGI